MVAVRAEPTFDTSSTDFHDVLHGKIQLTTSNKEDLVRDLLACPELQRLRYMRQMNFDVPFIQELGSSRRFPHSVGVCHIAMQMAIRSGLSTRDREALMAAALLHDAAIPPYGHLVETVLRKQHPGFDHEVMLTELLHGTAHLTNRYQQILPGRSLRVPKVLRKHNIDPETVLNLVRPLKGQKTAISADVDLDNIDNVHRMAVMLGWPNVKENLNELVYGCSIDSSISLVFSESVVDNLLFWQDIRQRIYTLIIAHPQCVAENAFQSDLVSKAVDAEIITPKNWFMVEPEFENLMRADPNTCSLAEQIISGRRYALVDYIWFKSLGPQAPPDWKNIEKTITPLLPELPEVEGYSFWVEHGLVSRAVHPTFLSGECKTLGQNSTSLFIARVHKESDVPAHRPDKAGQNKWRRDVIDALDRSIDNWEYRVDYPETYNGTFFSKNDTERQLELY